MKKDMKENTRGAKEPSSINSNDDRYSSDQEFRLLKALSYSALLNEVLMERVHGDKPSPGHQTLVSEGLIYLSFHIQDLLQKYIDVDSGGGAHE